MVQLNTDSGKERTIRQPRGWKPPSKALVPPGPTTVVNVPHGSPGTIIQIPHPRAKGTFISVRVPSTAKPGQAMLVPVPNHAHIPASAAGPRAKHVSKKPSPCPVPVAATATLATKPTSPLAPATSGKSEWTTGGRVATGTAAVLGVGGAAVGGAILGEHIAEHGLDATVEAAEFVVEAAEDVGDFVMDLF